MWTETQGGNPADKDGRAVQAAACTRDRLLLLLAFSLIVVAGLASRQWPMSAALGQYPGDALWASALYTVLALCWPRSSCRQLLLLSLVLSSLVELQQMLQMDWLRALRATVPGYLLLGHGFHAPDLLAYLAGALLAALLDLQLFCRARLLPAGANTASGRLRR